MTVTLEREGKMQEWVRVWETRRVTWKDTVSGETGEPGEPGVPGQKGRDGPPGEPGRIGGVGRDL